MSVHNKLFEFCWQYSMYLGENMKCSDSLYGRDTFGDPHTYIGSSIKMNLSKELCEDMVKGIQFQSR
jgi:hypothetical protein